MADISKHCFEECFDKVKELTDLERGTAAYIARYITRKDFKKNVTLPVDVDAAYIKDCEFLQLVNRGELLLPLQSIYELVL